MFARSCCLLCVVTSDLQFSRSTRFDILWPTWKNAKHAWCPRISATQQLLVFATMVVKLHKFSWLVNDHLTEVINWWRNVSRASILLPWCDMLLIVCGMLFIVKFRVFYSLFGKCCVNIIASKCLFTLQQSFGIAHEIAVKTKLFCGLMLLSKSTFDTHNQWHSMKNGNVLVLIRACIWLPKLTKTM